MPTLNPVLPRLRRGMESARAGASEALVSGARAVDPMAAAVIAPVDLRNVLRLLADELPALVLLMVPPHVGKSTPAMCRI